MTNQPTPLVSLTLYTKWKDTPALVIRQDDDVMLIELGEEELKIVRESLDKLIALIERKMVWQEDPQTEDQEEAAVEEEEWRRLIDHTLADREDPQRKKHEEGGEKA